MMLKLRVRAAYHQVAIRDSFSKSELVDWSRADLSSRFLASDDAIVLSTSDDNEIVVEFSMVTREDEIEEKSSIFNIRRPIDVRSGALLISGVSDYAPGIEPIPVREGKYVLKAYFLDDINTIRLYLINQE